MTQQHFETEDIRLDAERDPNVFPHKQGIMARAAVTLIGEGAWAQALNKARAYFAKQGLIGWQIDDGNTLIDVVPMPQEYSGEFGYRITFAAFTGGQMKAIKILFPYSQLRNRKPQ